MGENQVEEPPNGSAMKNHGPAFPFPFAKSEGGVRGGLNHMES